MELITLLSGVVFSKFATPVWGIVSGYLMYRLKASSNKRDDFTVIRDSLYSEIDRLKSTVEENQARLSQSEAENEEHKARYYELNTQHRELLKHCIYLTKEMKKMKSELDNVNKKNCE